MTNHRTCGNCDFYRPETGVCILLLIGDTEAVVMPERNGCDNYCERREYPWGIERREGN